MAALPVALLLAFWHVALHMPGLAWLVTKVHKGTPAARCSFLEWSCLAVLRSSSKPMHDCACSETQ